MFGAVQDFHKTRDGTIDPQTLVYLSGVRFAKDPSDLVFRAKIIGSLTHEQHRKGTN